MTPQGYGFEGPAVRREEIRTYVVTGEPPELPVQYGRIDRTFIPHQVTVTLVAGFLESVVATGPMVLKTRVSELKRGRFGWYGADVRRLPDWLTPLVRDVPDNGE